MPRLPPAYRLIVRETVDSTNIVARALAEAGAEHGTLVWAREQTAGRGRLGRQWASPPGNLYLSLVLRPARSPAQAPQLSFLAAVALGDAVAGVLPPPIAPTLKWPNDLLLGGRKVAGILLEAAMAPTGALDFLVLGIGVNVASHPTANAYPTTDLTEAGAGTTVPVLLELVAGHVASWLDRWLADGFAPVRAAWLARAHGLGQPIDVRLGNTLISGRFCDLDEDGALVVETAAGVRHRVTAGDVVDRTAQPV